MVKTICAVIVGVVLGASAGTTSALVLTGPDILFDSGLSGGAGQNLFGPRGLSFDASTGLLSVSAQAINVSGTPVTGGTVDVQAHLRASSFFPLPAPLNGIVTGVFETDGIPGDDLIVADSTGDLLRGEILSFSLTGLTLPGNQSGGGDATFLPTGGSLLPSFLGLTGGIVHLSFNLTPALNALTFSNDFSAQIKGDIAPVRQPAPLVLLGGSLLVVALVVRCRTHRARGSARS